MKLSTSVKKALKVVVLGEKDSGKTALTVRFLTGKFIHDYATGEDYTYPHQVIMNRTEIELEIVDTSQNIISSAIMDAHGVIIVYAINNTNSFQRAKELISHVQEMSESLSCVAIVGNKLDMWHYRTVMRSDGEYLAKKNGCLYFELSALSDGEGVNRMFTVLVKLVNDNVNKRFKCHSVIIENTNNNVDSVQFEGRRRARSLHLPNQRETSKKQTLSQKSPILFRRLLRSWNQSVGMNRSKSTEKLF